MTILKSFNKKITIFFFSICFFAFINDCYSEYTIAPGERIIFTANNDANSSDSMTGINVVVTKNVIEGVDFIEIEDEMPDSIPVGSSASLVLKAIEDGTADSTMEINFQLQGTSESLWIPSTWEETVTVNFRGSNSTTYSGPTLSEWKQIFFTLLMLTLVLVTLHRKQRLSTTTNPEERFMISDLFPIYPSLLSLVINRLFLVTCVFYSIYLIWNEFTLVDLSGFIICTPLLGYAVHIFISIGKLSKSQIMREQ